MAEAKQISFTFQEIATLLVREQAIHDGHWGIFVKFGIQATNIKTSPNDLLPAAVIPVLELGIQRFDEANPLTVDASQVNPGQKKK